MSSNPTRREFLSKSALGVAGAALVSTIASRAHAAGNDVIRVGLIGCGGRGTGAASQALNADKNVKLVALGDAFSDRLEESLANLKKIAGDKVAVENDKKFIGFDAYKQVIDCGVDVVILGGPPGFRPQHIKYAVEQGKHVFAEKPVAVDGPGVRSVLETCELAKKKNLSIVSGLCWRYHTPKRETIGHLHDGAIGDIHTIQSTYNIGKLKHYPRQPQWSDMEWQVRNWTYFVWGSGDFIVEQHVHSLDKAAWVMKDTYPVKASASGGRQVRTGPEFGHIYDHFNTVYEFANGTKCFSSCRQIMNCDNDISDYVYGTKGMCDIMKHTIAGEKSWKIDRDAEKGAKDMYQQEHDELFASIRSGKPINNGEYMTKSTLMAIMGRMAAYTGKVITWDMALNSKEDTFPQKLEWGSLPVPPVAMPGVTKFA